MNPREESKETIAITSLEEVEVKEVGEANGGKQRSNCAIISLEEVEVKEVGEPQDGKHRNKCYHQLGRSRS